MGVVGWMSDGFIRIIRHFPHKKLAGANGQMRAFTGRFIEEVVYRVFRVLIWDDILRICHEMICNEDATKDVRSPVFSNNRAAASSFNLRISFSDSLRRCSMDDRCCSCATKS